MPKTLLTIIALIAASFALSGCANTVTGVSKDIKQSGHAVKRAVQ